MAQLVIKRAPNPEAATKQENIITDWDSFLYSLWLDIIKTNPRLYDDIKVSHNQGTCSCKCTGNLYLREGNRRHK